MPFLFRKRKKVQTAVKEKAYKLEDVLNRVLQSVYAEAQKKGIELYLQIDKELPRQLIGDSDSIGCVLEDICENALRFTSQGRITFTVQGEQSDRGPLLLRVFVADTGRGIPEGKLGKLFTQDENVRLCHVGALVREMHGQIRVFSAEETGTLLNVMIPQQYAENIGRIRDISPLPWSNILESCSGWEEAEPVGAGTIGAGTIEAGISERVHLIRKQLGVEYCGGNRTMYLDVLSSYREEVAENIELIKDYYTLKDWKNYEILVHALKSSSLTIGAGTLSEEAKAHEMAAKSGDEEFIGKGFEHLYEQCHIVIEEAEAILKEDGYAAQKEEESANKEVKSVSAEQFSEMLEKLLEMVAAYDMSSAMEQVERMEQTDVIRGNERKAKEKLGRIKEEISNFAYEEAEEEIKEWMAHKE